jgi:hypothetical protein
MNTQKIKRSQAAALLDLIRRDLAQRTPPAEIEARIARGYGRSPYELPAIPPLEVCDHDQRNDHCGVCAPRWGFVGVYVGVT